MTRILVISDVHANVTALEAVLKKAGSVDEVWCLGDLVGYGPDPNECVSMIRETPHLVCLMGNHDLAATGGLGLETFNGDAHRSLLWQKRVLSKENLKFLKGLPTTTQVVKEVSLVHGSPRDPIWEYIMNPEIARQNLDHFDTKSCFIGHTHYQIIIHWSSEDDLEVIETPEPGYLFELDGRTILNPGSVGQPRDRDNRSAYAIYDPDKNTWQTQRVDYDHKQVRERILKLGLPPYHANRLENGW